MKIIHIECPCCKDSLNIVINETGKIFLQSFDLYGTEIVQKVNKNNVIEN